MPLSPSGGPSYDEQLGMTFTQSFTSMLYNVTAVAQQDPTSGMGPAYLLNGLSDTGYWYQVGLSWNWNPGYFPGTGFDMNYEVFDSSGNSVFPTNGGGGLLSFSGPVYQGDSVVLKLYFTSSGQVVMLAEDQNTGAYASETYSAEGATYFVGLSSNTANSNGFFTGLMTEWYHPSPYYGNEQAVVYASDLALSSAWMWVDEYEPPCCSNSLFEGSTSGPVSYASNPTLLQEFSSNGATEYSDAHEFVTGSLSVVTMTLSYSVHGGSSAPTPPVFAYVSNGVEQAATLGTTPTKFLVDANTAWNVTNPLTGSSSDERWQTSQQTSGVATSSQTVVFQYYQQYRVAFGYQSGSGGGPPQITYFEFGAQQIAPPGAQVWADAGSQYQYQNPLQGSTSEERWYSQDPSGTVASPGAITAVYYTQYLVTFDFSVLGGGGGSSPPVVDYTSLGERATAVANASVWADDGSAFSYPSVVRGSNAQERWVLESRVPRAVAGSVVVDAVYQRQFYVAVTSAEPAGGTASPLSGWYNATQTLTLSASPSPGWRFEDWVGPYSGGANPTTLSVDSPINETAVFYPGVTIRAGGDGSVAYSYGSTSGMVPPGASATVYFPVGAEVYLSAHPSLFVYSFEGWSGAASNRSARISLTVRAPASIEAEYGYDYASIGSLTLVAVAAVGGGVYAASRRRGRRGGRASATCSPPAAPIGPFGCRGPSVGIPLCPSAGTEGCEPCPGAGLPWGRRARSTDGL
jgi:hypothetical protein